MEPRHLLNSLHKDVKKHLLPEFLGPGGVINLAKTSRHFYSLFNENSAYANALPVLKKLCNHVARGEQNEAEQILKKFPDLLACTVTIAHLGRYNCVNRTPYQLALANADANMYCMMEKYFNCLVNGQKIMQTQFNQQFPDGKIIKHISDINAVKWKLRYLIDAINVDPLINEDDLTQVSDVTLDKLKEFYDLVSPKSSDQFTTGLLFDMAVYTEAFIQREENTLKFPSNAQISFYCVHVIGHLQRLLPTGFLRTTCEGIELIMEQNKLLTGGGCYLLKAKRSILPLDLDPQSRLGAHFYINHLGRVIKEPNHDYYFFMQTLTKLISRQYSKLEELRIRFLPIKEPSPPRVELCVIN